MKSTRENRDKKPKKINMTQIDHYLDANESENEFKEKLANVLENSSAEAGMELYHDLVIYQDAYQKKVMDFHQRYVKDGTTPDTGDSQYFRKKFAAYLEEKVLNKKDNEFKGDIDLKLTHPEKCTTKMNSFLGAYGEKLYQLALEEEANSLNYINTVLNKSVAEYGEGEKWLEKLIVVVGGASGSGKSFAAEYVVQEAQSFIKKETNSPEDNVNYVISVDGGVVREVSQMRKLLIHTATSKGYTGIIDLHEASSVLENVKSNILKFALHPKNSHGVVIPETFTKYGVPVVGAETNALLKTIGTYPEAKVVFSQVKGKDKEKFREVVKWMGDLRAFGNKGEGNSNIIDMNQKCCESKLYNPRWFDRGILCSEKAEKDFVKQYPNCISLTVVNDLVLMKEGKKTFFVSEKIVKKYEEALEQNPRLLLSEFKNLDENKKLGPVIIPSELFKLSACLYEIAKIQKVIFEHYQTDYANYLKNPETENISMEILKCATIDELINNIKMDLNNAKSTLEHIDALKKILIDIRPERYSKKFSAFLVPLQESIEILEKDCIKILEKDAKNLKPYTNDKVFNVAKNSPLMFTAKQNPSHVTLLSSNENKVEVKPKK